MVFQPEGQGVVLKSSSMAVGPERTKPLHNFDLPVLRWGSQRFLRCMKVNSDGGEGGGGTDLRSVGSHLGSSFTARRRESEPERRRIRILKPIMENDNDGQGIAEMREKLMFDLKTAADRIKDAIFREEVEEGGADADDDDDAEAGEQSPAAAAVAAAASEVRPWNLRTRRAACKAPASGRTGGGGQSLKIEERKPNYSPLRTGGHNGAKSPRLVRGLPEKKERAKFSVVLMRKEIEEDFMELFGHKPPRRPKKRPRIVQKQLDSVFPGLFLNEVSTDTYKVPEVPENGKR